MKTRRFAVNEYVTSKEIKDVRKKLGLTQKEFAQLLEFPSLQSNVGNGKIHR